KHRDGQLAREQIAEEILDRIPQHQNECEKPHRRKAGTEHAFKDVAIEQVQQRATVIARSSQTDSAATRRFRKSLRRAVSRLAQTLAAPPTKASAVPST